MFNRAEEARLVERAKTDAQALGELYERYVKRIYNYIYYRTGSASDAEDLTARVFQRAIKHLPGYTDKGLPFSAWLYRIAHNLVANWHRDQSRRREAPLEDHLADTVSPDTPEGLAAQVECPTPGLAR
ncbi:MAG: sigma-70 family RNA polymerase sigma factor [Chloroflexi bacterium]|nr:sigma-70 family RNA polymerase sigma factor [Chloroflexota bacterium]